LKPRNNDVRSLRVTIYY